MLDFLFQNGAAWFSVPAILGTLLFLVQMTGLLGDDGSDMGGAGDSAGAGGHAGGGDAGGGDAGGGDAGGSLDAGAGGSTGAESHGHGLAGVVSLQSCAAFAMGFGLGGLASLRGSEFGVGWSIGIGIGCGVVFVAVLGFLFGQARKLNSSGNMGIGVLVGREADVTAAIPAEGAGRGEIRAVVGDRERRCAATSAGGAIATRSRVVVVRVNGDNSVTVRPVAG